MVNVEDLIKRSDRLKADRGTLESHWQECAKYCLPKRAFITRTKTPGQKMDSDIYDSTAIQAALILAAGLHSYLTNPATKWFAFRMQDAKLMEDKGLRLWLKDAEDITYDALNASNFAQQIHEVFLDLGVFGTACLYEEEDVKDMVRFYCRSMGEILIEEDDKERVNAVFRIFTLTASQAFSAWGNEAGEAIRDAIASKDYNKTFEFRHAVTPRHQFDPAKEDAENMPYSSVYIEVSKKHLVSEGGYNEFPFFAPRFTKESGEVYGASPAMVSLPDIKMLNKMSYTIMRAAQKIVDPPLVLPNDGFLLPIRLGPAALNFKTNANSDPNAKIEPIQQAGNIPVGMEMEQQRREIIRRNFFVDLFLMLADNPNMTATEVLQRVQEKMLILAPVLGRLMSELLDPIIERTFNILLRNGKFGEVPEILLKNDYVIEYTSPLARAQKGEEIKNIQSFLMTAEAVSRSIPITIDKLNGDKIIDFGAKFYNVPLSIIRDDKEVKVIRDARAQAQQQQMELEMAGQAAGIGKTAAEIKEISGGKKNG